MSSETKERIIEAALELFAQNGYLGTSMNDIAKKIGITKGALYKHYSGKRDIFDKIVERMNKNDAERANEYDMPKVETEEAAESYLHITADKIYAYSVAQFRHWTEEKFSADFRKMLTLEQYRDSEMSRLYHEYLACGP